MNCLPNLYVPGFPKSATTSISLALAQHPQIFSPITVEPHYWAADLPFYAAREGLNSLVAYSSLYKRATERHQWRLDGSTLYLYSETAAASIVKNIPNAKFIVCLRDPEDIVLAWHMQMLNGNYESEKNPEIAFNLSSQRRKSQNIPQHCPDARLLDYERIAAVGTQLLRLMDTVGVENIHIVTMTSVKHEPLVALERCWNFLGVKNAPDISLTQSNGAFSVRHPLLRKSIYHPKVKPHVTKILNKLPTQLSKPTRNIFRKAVYQKTKREPASDSFRSFLSEFYSEERRVLKNCFLRLPNGSELNDSI